MPHFSKWHSIPPFHLTVFSVPHSNKRVAQLFSSTDKKSPRPHFQSRVYPSLSCIPPEPHLCRWLQNIRATLFQGFLVQPLKAMHSLQPNRLHRVRASTSRPSASLLHTLVEELTEPYLLITFQPLPNKTTLCKTTSRWVSSVMISIHVMKKYSYCSSFFFPLLAFYLS